MSLAKQLIESGKASDELMDAYLNLQMGEFDVIVRDHRIRTKRAQTRERVRKHRANKKMENNK